jgi:hypothetical protein
MQRYASYSKILEDTRVLKSRHANGYFAIAIRVPAFEIRKTKFGSLTELQSLEQDFSRGGVCLGADFFKKTRKKFKISSFCPLTIATKGDTMINNMVLSREIEWIGYEHKRNMLQVEFIVGSIYQYENVPETVYQEFLTAPSYGRYFESNIKNKYHVRKVR